MLSVVAQPLEFSHCVIHRILNKISETGNVSGRLGQACKHATIQKDGLLKTNHQNKSHYELRVITTAPSEGYRYQSFEANYSIPTASRPMVCVRLH